MIVIIIGCSGCSGSSYVVHRKYRMRIVRWLLFDMMIMVVMMLMVVVVMGGAAASSRQMIINNWMMRMKWSYYDCVCIIITNSIIM